MAEQRWKFYDYRSDTGKNLFQEWLHSIPIEGRAAVNDLIDHLTKSTADSLSRPDVGQLRHECKGLIELVVKLPTMQVRPIGMYGTGRKEITLLTGALEKDNQLPRRICDLANKRAKDVRDDPERYRVRHPIS